MRTARIVLFLVVAWSASASAARPATSAKTSLGRRVLRGVGKVARTLWLGVKVQAAVTLTAIATNTVMPDEQKTIVYSAGHIYGADEKERVPTWLVTGLVDAAMEGPIVLRENLLGRKVVWKHDATWADIDGTIGDPGYQSVVFVGHGSTGLFAAKDGLYFSYGYRGAKKRGDVMQYTCGGGGLQSFRETMLADPTRGFAFSRPVLEGTNWLATWHNLGAAAVLGR